MNWARRAASGVALADRCFAKMSVTNWPGSQVASPGKNITSSSTLRSPRKNGMVPLSTCGSGIFDVPLTANRFRPTGGVTTPISTLSVTRMARCTGSIMSAMAMGKTTGTVRITIATPSTNMPRRISTNM